MIKVVLFGSGNVAQHLLIAFQQSAKVDVVQVVVRDINKAQLAVHKNLLTDNWDHIAMADLYLMAVTDGALVELSAKLPFTNRLIAHTSGSVALQDLDAKNRRAVFYPLQTFSKNRAVDYKHIPFCIESENEKDQCVLMQLAHYLSPNCYDINSEQRQALHVAAVFINNFVNHLYHIGEEICEEHQVPFEILKPLLTETAEKAQQLSPLLGQTGPAIRNDKNTINKHIGLLTKTNQQELYQLLTQSIQHTYLTK